MYKTIIKKLTIGLVISVFTFSAQAENLLQVYTAAKAYDAQLIALENEFLAVKEQKQQALANKGFRADLSASVNAQHTDVSGNSPFTQQGRTDFENNNYSLNVKKPLYNKAIDAQIKQADATVAQATATLENERQNLTIRVAESYFNFLKAQESLDFSNAEKAATSKQLEQVKAFFNNGHAAITDVQETQARYDLANAEVVDAKQQFDLARESLKVLTGKNYKRIAALRQNAPLTALKPNNVESWINLAQKSNKNLQAAQKAMEAANIEVEKQRAAKKPVVELVASHSGNYRRDYYNTNSDQYDTSIGVQLSVPLYTSGLTSSRVRAARFSYKQARQQYEFTKRQVTEQINNAFLTVQSTSSRIRARHQAVKSAQIALDASKKGFKYGTRTSVDVLTSLRETFSSKRDYENARYDHLLSKLQLKQAVGTLSINDIKSTNSLMSSHAKSNKKIK